MHQLIWRKRTNTEPYLSTNDHGLYNYTNFKRRILHNSTHSDWEFLGKEESTFSSKFGGRSKLEEREVTPMHFSHLKIEHNWFSVKYCKDVHLLTPMLSIFDVDMHLEQREDTSHLFWILICVNFQSKEGFVQALGFFSSAIGKKWKTTNPTIILRPLNYILCFMSTSLKQ